MRRKAIIALHWAVVLLVLAMTEGGSGAPVLRWAFTGLAALWLAIMLAGGPLGKPGPKLQGWARAIYRPLHLALYALLGITATLNATELLGLTNPGPAWTALLILLVTGLFHGIFHLWRHTTLYDGALRLMTPRLLHKYL
jgi:superoxide oxidase